MSDLTYKDLANLDRRCKKMRDAYANRNPDFKFTTLSEQDAWDDLKNLVLRIAARKGLLRS